MAVLKSQITTRNKKKWAKQYALKSYKLNYRTEERSHPRIMHKFQMFLRDLMPTIPVVSSEGPNKSTERLKEICPPAVMKNGRNRFDATTVNPVIFRKHFNAGSNKKRLLLLTSAFINVK